MYTFEKYITPLQQAYTTITRYQNATAPETMVQRMLDGIRVQSSLVLTMEKEHVLNTLMGGWLGAVAHMSTKVAANFPPWAARKRKKWDHRQILAAGKSGCQKGGQNKGHGGRGAAEVKIAIMSNDGSMTLTPRTPSSHSLQRI